MRECTARQSFIAVASLQNRYQLAIGILVGESADVSCDSRKERSLRPKLSPATTNSFESRNLREPSVRAATWLDIRVRTRQTQH